MRAYAIGVAAMRVVGCTADPQPQARAQNGRTWEHRCPAAGTIVQTSNGGSVSYAGTAAPGICRRTDGRFAIYGIWITDRGEAPKADVVEWLGSIFPASAGRSALMQRTDRAARSQDTHMWIREVRVVGFETLNLRAGQVDAILLEWTDSGTGANIHRARHRRWLDTQTGALVKSESRILGGNGAEHAWEAVSISRGTPAAQPQQRGPAVLAALDRLREARAAEQRVPARPLTDGEQQAIRNHLSRCVAQVGGQPPSGSVEFRVQIDITGTIQNVVPSSGVLPSGDEERRSYEVVRRGLLNPSCGPFPIPSDAYRTVMASVLRMNWVAASPGNSGSIPSPSDAEVRLRDIERLRANGLLSQTEYEAARQRILRDL